VKSALRIRSRADAKDEIEDMGKRFGNSFCEQSDHLRGDYIYDAQVHTLSVARFLIIAPTVLNRGVAIRNGQLHYVVVTTSLRRYPMRYARKPLDHVRPALPKHEVAETLRNSFRMFGNGLG